MGKPDNLQILYDLDQLNKCWFPSKCRVMAIYIIIFSLVESEHDIVETQELCLFGQNIYSEEQV